MDITRDPERNEINALLEFTGDLTGKRVLEIGAGSGRLTWRYAALAGEVIGIDPRPERIARAHNEMPTGLQGRVIMLETALEDYSPDAQASLFDVALMSWALWWIDAEGMVHALEITHSLLKRDGLLIDIHPSGKPPPVEVHVDGKALLAGYMQETDDFVEYFEADSALAEVTARKLFDLERDGLFPFMTHHPTITALTNYLEAEWSDAILPDDVVEQIEALMAEPGKSKEIVVREIVRISRYRVSSR